MVSIQAGQIKAARAILDWSQEDLAMATGLAINTVRNIELGYISPRHKTNHVIRQVIEKAGLEFTEGEGIKRRGGELQYYWGIDSQKLFFEEVVQTVKLTGGDIAITGQSQTLLAEACGVTAIGNIRYLKELTALVSVRCLLSEPAANSIISSSVHIRTTQHQFINPAPCFIYGDRLAMVALEQGTHPKFVIFRMPGMVQSYRSQFQMLWDSAALDGAQTF